MTSVNKISLESELNIDGVRKFAQDVLVPYENTDPESLDFSDEITRKLYDEGFLTLITPKEFGGVEAPVQDLAWVVRELAFGSASASATFIGNMLGYSAVVIYAQPELRAKVCRDFHREFGLWSFAMTEGGAGSDLVNIATTARRVKGGFVLNGEKNFITNATYSTHLSIFARLYDENGKDEGISCFYVPGSTMGLMRGDKMRKIGWKKANTGTILLKDAFVPETHLLGEPGQGLRILTQCLNRSKTLLGAVGVGIASRALHLVNERLSETARFGKPLLEQPAIKHLLARLHTQTEAAWLLTMKAAATWDQGLPAVKESSMAKLFSGNTAVAVANAAMELFGARGYFMEYEISRLMNDAKAIEIVEGPSLVQELLIAKEVLPCAQKNQKSIDPFKLQQSEVKKVAS